jgi:hypothetical protein
MTLHAGIRQEAANSAATAIGIGIRYSVRGDHVDATADYRRSIPQDLIGIKRLLSASRDSIRSAGDRPQQLRRTQRILIACASPS